MNVANIYKKLKQILNESNMALINRGLNKVDNLNDISFEIKKLGEINRLPYFIQGNVIALTESDLQGINTVDQTFNLEKYSFLTSVIIPDSVTTIGSSAFYKCTGLTSVTIPGSVTNIGSDAFYKCTGLTDIYLYPTLPPTLGNVYAISSISTIHVPVGSGDAYKNATNWSNYANKIVEDIEI